MIDRRKIQIGDIIFIGSIDISKDNLEKNVYVVTRRRPEMIVKRYLLRDRRGTKTYNFSKASGNVLRQSTVYTKEQFNLLMLRT